MSRERQILEALKARLEKITVENGYSRTVKQVRLSRSGMDLDVPPQDCPIIEIYQDTETPEHGAGAHINSNLDVLLLLIERKDADDLEMADFCADVRTCLYGDNPNANGMGGVTLGGVVTKVQWKNTVFDLNLIEANRRYVMEWTIRSALSAYKR